jgi:hypothetical protein
MSDTDSGVRERIPGSISHPSNRFWAATSLALLGWVVTIRVRRRGERQTYRRWIKIDVFNYNYTAEAKAASNEKNDVLSHDPFPSGGQEECHSCGQTIPHGHESSIQTNDRGNAHSNGGVE